MVTMSNVFPPATPVVGGSCVPFPVRTQLNCKNMPACKISLPFEGYKMKYILHISLVLVLFALSTHVLQAQTESDTADNSFTVDEILTFEATNPAPVSIGINASETNGAELDISANNLSDPIRITFLSIADTGADNAQVSGLDLTIQHNGSGNLDGQAVGDFQQGMAGLQVWNGTGGGLNQDQPVWENIGGTEMGFVGIDYTVETGENTLAGDNYVLELTFEVEDDL